MSTRNIIIGLVVVAILYYLLRRNKQVTPTPGANGTPGSSDVITPGNQVQPPVLPSATEVYQGFNPGPVIIPMVVQPLNSISTPMPYQQISPTLV